MAVVNDPRFSADDRIGKAGRRKFMDKSNVSTAFPYTAQAVSIAEADMEYRTPPYKVPLGLSHFVPLF